MSEPDWVALAASLAQRFAERAARHDREGSFPHENFAELREAGFMKLTVPRSHGGFELPLSAFVRVQESLAAGDGSTALSLNMHLIRFGAEREASVYPPEWFDELCRGAVEEGKLVNTAATEEGLGSPAGGGIPDTTATPVEGGWVLEGRKTFVTLAPELWYMPVLARLDSPD
ncbi:MAG: acyl-CoA dehydrogenase, partial [Dehalococcoidia bacterium]|nr:acyl-CoA dehydrogenase [Dehalococcoidia bacterium]